MFQIVHMHFFFKGSNNWNISALCQNNQSMIFHSLMNASMESENYQHINQHRAVSWECIPFLSPVPPLTMIHCCSREWQKIFQRPKMPFFVSPCVLVRILHQYLFKPLHMYYAKIMFGNANSSMFCSSIVLHAAYITGHSHHGTTHLFFQCSNSLAILPTNAVFIRFYHMNKKLRVDLMNQMEIQTELIIK